MLAGSKKIAGLSGKTFMFRQFYELSIHCVCVCVHCVFGVAPQNEMNQAGCKPTSLTAQSWARCPGHVGPMLAL